jgi:hypothetical protein
MRLVLMGAAALVCGLACLLAFTTDLLGEDQVWLVVPGLAGALAGLVLAVLGVMRLGRSGPGGSGGGHGR